MTTTLTFLQQIEFAFMEEAMDRGVNPLFCSSRILASLFVDFALKKYPSEFMYTTIPLGDSARIFWKKNRDDTITTPYGLKIENLSKYFTQGSMSVEKSIAEQTFWKLQREHPEAEFACEILDELQHARIIWKPVPPSALVAFLEKYFDDHGHPDENGTLIAPESHFPDGWFGELTKMYPKRVFTLNSCEGSVFLKWETRDVTKKI